jgi:hypothetical protein
MKIVAASLFAVSLISTNMSFASETKTIEAKAQLYAGTSVDVITYLEISLRNKAVETCGSSANVLGLSNYQIKIGARADQGLLKIDLNKPDYSGALIWSDSYPNGEASATVICR